MDTTRGNLRVNHLRFLAGRAHCGTPTDPLNNARYLMSINCDRFVITICLLSAAILSSGAASGQEPKAMTTTQFQQYVAGLRADGDRWRSRLAGIDVESLRIDYSEGKIFEKHKELCLKYAARIKKRAENLARNDTLALDIGLLVDLKSFGGELGGFTDILNSPVTISDFQAQKKSQQWAEVVFSVYEELDKRTDELYPHILAVAERAEPCLKNGR